MPWSAVMHVAVARVDSVWRIWTVEEAHAEVRDHQQVPQANQQTDLRKMACVGPTEIKSPPVSAVGVDAQFPPLYNNVMYRFRNGGFTNKCCLGNVSQFNTLCLEQSDMKRLLIT